ncbi:MAG: Gfo/Idh/MocA family oxidoreductase [Methanophagales archaeon]|nr:Gfo/Idh/MocA family oxidoreductase [Methanophagales archaeon]
MIRVGVVGVGEMGEHHVRVYNEIEDTDLVGIGDVNDRRVKDIADQYRTKAFTDYKDLLREDLNAVSIAVPTILHKKVAIDFIREGVNCLIEKPIASSIEDAREIIKEAEKNNAKLAIGHIERFNPAVMKLKEIIEKGILGKMLLISTRRVGPFVPRITDVGIIVDSATHDIDVIRYLVGKEPVNIFVKSGGIKNKKGDHAIVVLDFGDVSASIEVNWFTPHKVRSLVATGTEGIAYLDYLKQEVVIYNSEWKMIPKIERKEPLKVELEHFLECLKNNKKPLVSGYEGLKVLEIAIKAENYHE